MKKQVAKNSIGVMGVLVCLIMECFTFEEPYTVEFDAISKDDKMNKTENLAYPICYMNCHENPNCKGVAFEMYKDNFFGDCYQLSHYPQECLENNGIFTRPVIIGRKLTSGCSGGNLPDGCEGTENNPARSCYDLRMQNSLLKSGYYWMNFCKPTLVYCDMETAGGGWMLTGSAVVTSNVNPSEFIANQIKSSDITKLNNVKSGKFFLSNIGLERLRAYTKFSQIRIYCTKENHNRTFHLMTTEDELGGSVVDYLSLKVDSLPQACNSYIRLEDDTSKLGSRCSRWEDGKWSGDFIPSSDIRSFDHLAFDNVNMCAINLIDRKNTIRLECDDWNTNVGYDHYGVWKYYVR